MFDAFPSKPWKEMTSAEQTHFRDMEEDQLVARWHSTAGLEIKEKIIAVNLAYDSSEEYKKFLGTVKADCRR